MKGLKMLWVVVAVAVLAAATTVLADGGVRGRAVLRGFQEVPALVSQGSGSFRVAISQDGTEFSYELRYEDLEGEVTQAHIHVGQRAVNGGIAVFLCTNLGNGPAGTQGCPPAPAVVTGTITAGDVIGPSGQGVDAGEFADLLRAMREGFTYANVHTDRFPGGEIRGQIRVESPGRRPR